MFLGQFVVGALFDAALRCENLNVRTIFTPIRAKISVFIMVEKKFIPLLACFICYESQSQNLLRTQVREHDGRARIHSVNFFHYN